MWPDLRSIVPGMKARTTRTAPMRSICSALSQAVDCSAKACTLGIIGVYPPAAETYPIGKAMNKNLPLNAGNCNHRACIPKPVEMVRIGRIDPVQILTKVQPLTDAIEAYEHFDGREAGWIKTELNFAKAAE